MQTKFYTATVSNCDSETRNIPLEVRTEGTRLAVFITPNTIFKGAVEDKAAYESCKRPGLSVNVWVQGSMVIEASPNYK